MPTKSGMKGSEGARGRRGARDGNTKDQLPSEKWAVLTRAELEELVAVASCLTEWIQALHVIVEQLNDKLTVVKPPYPPSLPMGKPLSFYREETHPNQIPMWDGLLDK